MDGRRFVLLLGLGLAVICCSGCAQSAADRLAGKWQGKLELNEEKVQEETAKVQNNPLARMALEKMLEGVRNGSMDIEFRPNGSYSMSFTMGPLQNTTSGTWAVASHEGQVVRLGMTDDQGKTRDTTLRFTGTDSFTVAAPGNNSQYVVFRCKRL